MTLRQFLAILRARWLIGATVVLLAFAVAGAVTWLLPKKYAATATLVIDVKSPDPIAGFVSPAMTMPSYMATQVEIIENDRVALRVVRNLRMNDNAAMRTQWQQETQGVGGFDIWLANLLQKNLDVKPSRESNLIHISFKSVDPRFSAAVANAFAQAYIDTTLELRVEPARQYSSFFDERAKQARDEVERAQARLSAFQRSKEILATDERLDIETSRLNELSTQMVVLQAASAESRSRQSAARTAPDRLGDVINHPVVTGLRSDLTRQEARLQEISARFGDAYPQVAELKANIAELQARLEQESTRLSGSVGVANDINQSREGQVRASLEQQRAKVLQVRAQRDEIAVLQREVEHAQRAYDAVMTRLNQALLESQNKLTNASLLMAASEPSRPASPQPLFNLVVAGFAGLLAAILLALLRESLDRRVRLPEDVSRGMGLPVLGVLGNERGGRGGRRQGIPVRLLGPGAALKS